MSYKFQQIEPQPARGKLVESMWDDDRYIAEIKYDGFRMISQVGDDHVRLTSRRVSVKTNEYQIRSEQMPHVSYTSGPVTATGRVYAFPKALAGTVLDGEVVLMHAHEAAVRASDPSGGLSKHVGSIINSLPEEAVRKQIERGWLRYIVFDCLAFKGRSLLDSPLVSRKVAMEKALSIWGNPYVEEAFAARTDKRRFMQDVMARGGEGVILKRIDHKYGDQKEWVKVKGEWTADVVIMGFEAAKAESKKKGDTKKTITKYAKAGLIGAIKCGQFKAYKHADGLEGLVTVATVSGMDDDLRASFTREPEQYVGQVIEIAHNGREPTGRFRHPRFKRFRTDKRPEDCIYREEEI